MLCSSCSFKVSSRISESISSSLDFTRSCFFSVFTRFSPCGSAGSAGSSAMAAAWRPGRLSLFLGCWELLRLSTYSSLVSKMMLFSKASLSKSSSSSLDSR